MSVRDVVAGGVGVVLGAAISKMPIRLPTDVATALARLKFVDTKTNVELTGIHVYGYGTEDSWQVWMVGYGLPSFLPNDVVLDVGKHATEGIHVTIMRGGHNPIDVYLDGVTIVGKMGTFEEITTQNQVYGGTLWIKLV